MGPIDIVIIVAIVLACIGVLVYLILSKAKGKNVGCGCNCANCPSAGGCASAKKAEEPKAKEESSCPCCKGKSAEEKSDDQTV